MKEKVKDYEENERWTCLLFDEMSIKQDLVIIPVDIYDTMKRSRPGLCNIVCILHIAYCKSTKFGHYKIWRIHYFVGDNRGFSLYNSI